MTLWDKGKKVDENIHSFTVGNDVLLDKKLVKYDCEASIAHAKMLAKVGLIDEKEAQSLVDTLGAIISLDKIGTFSIKPEEEDCHTAIENYLVSELGDVGKKIHTGRSRNDQVLTAMRLYEKDALQELLKAAEKVISALQGKKGDIPMPGYTHMQKAMPTTIGAWLGSHANSLSDSLELVKVVQNLVDRSPLGSAAGFGVEGLELDKEMTAKEMGFATVQENPMHCQLSRGKIEGMILGACSQIMLDLNRLVTDLLMFSMVEFGYVKLPAEFCTGSSIMPQKKNPDVLELVRAKYHVVLGEEMKVMGMTAGLISGYNRDMQLTKEPLFNGLDITLQSLVIMEKVVFGLEIDSEACKKAMTSELYATEEAYKLVKEGVPFRVAYREVGKKYQ